MSNLSEAKVFGGIGALLTIFTGIYFIPGLIGIVLLLIGVKKIADEAKEKKIFDHFLYFFIIMIVSFIVAGAIIMATFQAVGGITFFMDLQNYTDPMVIFEMLQPVIYGGLAALFSFWILSIISTLFLKKSYDKIGDITKVKWFKTTGLLFLIGAGTTIIIIGFLILLIAMVLEIVAFFSLPDNIPENSKDKTITNEIK